MPPVRPPADCARRPAHALLVPFAMYLSLVPLAGLLCRSCPLGLRTPTIALGLAPRTCHDTSAGPRHTPHHPRLQAPTCRAPGGHASPGGPNSIPISLVLSPSTGTPEACRSELLPLSTPPARVPLALLTRAFQTSNLPEPWSRPPAGLLWGACPHAPLCLLARARHVRRCLPGPTVAPSGGFAAPFAYAHLWRLQVSAPGPGLRLPDFQDWHCPLSVVTVP